MTATDRLGERRSANRRLVRRGLLALPAALVLVAAVAPPLAQGSETSGYGQTAPKPTTTPTPKTSVEPSKKAAAPVTTPKASTEPMTAAKAPATQSTLPFTGLNLMWVVGIGALLLTAGLAIRLALHPRSADRP
jgi:hypothetical protein